MRAIRWTSTAAVTLMCAVIFYGIVVGDFGEEFGIMASIPWGRVSLVDLYLALLVGGSWIAWRERSALASMVWLVIVAALGSLALAIYIARASWHSDDVAELLLGRERATARRRHRHHDDD